MLHWLPGIFALLVAVTGWHYLFYSKLGHRLNAIEDPQTNLKRRRFRKLGGLSMLLLGGFFYAGFYAVDPHHQPVGFVAIWLTVFLLLGMIVLLALLDLRLTAKLRRKQ